MAKRSVKSLHRSGRVSRTKARSVAKILRRDLESGKIRKVSGKRIVSTTTASGRSAIAFFVTPSDVSRKPAEARTARKAAR